MFVHIFNRETVYSYQFISLLENFFSPDDHRIIFRSRHTFKAWDYGKIKNHIQYIDSRTAFIRQLSPLLKRCDKVMVHYLANSPVLLYWLMHKKIREKMVWVQWGDDLYFYAQNKNLKGNLYEVLRKRLIRRLPYISGLLREDYELTRKVYHTGAAYYHTFYPNPLDYRQLEFKEHENAHEKMHVLVGNSASPANNHIEILTALLTLRNRIEVYCPLPYGGSEEYTTRVIRFGKENFGKDFHYFLVRLSPEEYGKFLNSMDVAVMNHKRQQGVGNILGLLYLGKKVFIRNEVTTYQFLTRSGIKVFQTNDILKGDMNEVKPLKQSFRISNHEHIKSAFSEERCARLWNQLFNA